MKKIYSLLLLGGLLFFGVNEVNAAKAYLVNSSNWATPKCHAWKTSNTGDNNGWPGDEMYLEDFKIDGYSVYSFEMGEYNALIFSNNGASQTADQNFNSSTPYFRDNNWSTIKSFYFVNNKSWEASNVKCHVWEQAYKETNKNGWPGDVLESTGASVNGFPIFKYNTLAYHNYDRVVFSNNGSAQTSDIVIDYEKYFYETAKVYEWFESASAIETATGGYASQKYLRMYVRGTMSTTPWDLSNPMSAVGSDIWSKTLSLTAETPYEFQFAINNDWTVFRAGFNTTGPITVNTVAYHSGNNNIQFTPATTGSYTFILDVTEETAKIIVTDGSTFSITYDSNGAQTGLVPTDVNNYTIYEEVTVLGNTGSLDKIGYDFSHWTTAANGSGASYSAGDKVRMVPGLTLYAQWAEAPEAITYHFRYVGTPVWETIKAYTWKSGGSDTWPGVDATVESSWVKYDITYPTKDRIIFNDGTTAGDGHETKTIEVDGSTKNVYVTYDGGTKATTTIVSNTISVKFTADGYASLCAPFPVEIPDGITVYSVAYTAGAATALLREEDDFTSNGVPANTPVILKGGSGTVNLNYQLTAGSLADGHTNNLSGTLIRTAKSDYTYVLGRVGDVTGFYKYTADNIPANKAYLYSATPVPAGAPMIRFEENNATDIKGVEANEAAVKFIENGKLFIQKNGVVYDMMGTIVK